MFEFYPYATEKGNIPNTKVSKINFPNNSFGRFITGNGAEYKYSCTLAEINSYLRQWSEY